MDNNLQALIADMDLRFKSGNSVPVRTVQLTAETWAEIRTALEAATAMQSSGGEVEPYSISWADYWIGQGNFPLANDFETFELANAWLQANRTASPAQPSGFVLVPDDVIAFLNGTGELHGCTFGETPPGVRGKYWWRNYLTAAPAPIEQEG